MALTKIDSSLLVKGSLSCETLAIPDNTIDDDAVSASAAIAATKLEHQHVLTYRQADGSDVVAAIVPLYTVRGSTGEIVDIEVVVLDAPSGGDQAISVDLKLASESSPTPATVLSSAVTYSATQSDCEVETGVVSSSDLADGDTIVLDVSVSGSTGSQGQGLCVSVTIREDAE